MARGFIAVCAAAMLLALIALGSADAHTPGTATCSSAKGKTLVVGPSGRVYAPPQKPVSMPGERVLDACLNSMAHPVRLSPRTTEPTETEKAHYERTGGPLQLQGPWVAGVATTRTGIDTSRVAIKALNLKTGAVKQCADWTNVGHPGGKVTVVVLKPNGSTAWTGMRRELEPAPFAPGTPYETGEIGKYTPPAPPRLVVEKAVTACTATGAQLLDKGEGIDLESLELHGSTLIWTDSGETRSATLY